MNPSPKILIVDDDKTVLTMTKHVITSGGYQVKSAENAAEAFNLVRNDHPDLLLLDVNLPDKSGIELCREIKQDASLQGTFVVMLSAVATDSESQAVGLEAGADGYIARPIGNRELLARVQSMLRVHAAEQSARQAQAQAHDLLQQSNKSRRALLSILEDHKRMEEALRRSEDQYRMILQTAMDGFWLADTQGRLIDVNDRYCQMSGYTREELLHMNIVNLAVTNSEEDVSARMEKIMHEGEDRFESIHRRKDGSKFYVEVGVQYKAMDGGRFVVFLHDITNRKLAEEKINSARQFLRSIQNALAASLAVLDENGTIIQVNASWRKFGAANGLKASDDGLGMNYLKVCDNAAAEHPEAALVAQAIRSLLAGDAQETQIEYPCHDAREKRWFVVNITKFMDGQKPRIVLAHENITDRKLAEEALRESKETFQTLFNAGSDAVLVHHLGEDGPPGKFINANDAACKSYGYSKEELLDLSPMQLDDPATFEQNGLPAIQRLLTEGSATFETLHVAKDGRKIPVEIKSEVFTLQGGRAVMSLARDITERKEAEKKLREYQSQLEFQNAELRKFSLAIEQSGNTIVITNTKGIIEYANPRFEETTGYSVREALGKHTRILKSGKQSREYYKELWSAIGSGQIWHGEFCNRRKDGQSYWESATIAPVTDPDGKTTHYIAIKEEITERKRSESILQAHFRITQFAANHSLSELLQNALDEMCALSESLIGFFHFVEADQKTLTLQVWSTHTLENMCSAEGKGNHYDIDQAGVWVDCARERRPIIHNDYESLPHRRGLPEGHAPITREMVFPIIRNDKIVAVIGVGNKTADYTQEDVEYVSRLADLIWEVSERKRLEDVVKENEARFRDMLENAGDIIARFDAQGVVTYVNPAAIRIMSLDNQAEIIGKTYRDFISQEIYERLAQTLNEQVANNQESVYGEYPIQTKHGTDIWLGLNARIIYENGQVAGAQIEARDITKIKEAQDAMLLAHDQAVKASKLKSQLIAKVSHELRTPLSSVIGFAELLQYNIFGGELNEQQMEAVEQIIDSARYLTDMVNEFLDESEIETKSLALDYKPFVLADVLKHVESAMSIIASKKGLALKTSLAPDLPETMWGDARRLQQILINLTNNAIKFTRVGEVSIHVLKQSEDTWSIQVKDTGVGIPRDAQEMIFEPFKQIDNAITRENQGTGLGLTITKQLVELMNGRILVESEVGKGSVFTIILPIQKA